MRRLVIDKKKLKGYISIVIVIFLAFLYWVSFKIIFINGDSMYPSLQNNQIVLLFRIPYSLQLKEVVVFIEEDMTLIKRIVAVPGDIVELKDGKVFCNGVIKEPYTYEGDVRTYKLEANEFFVIGDNFLRSMDSRAFGPIDRDQIIGKIILPRIS